MFGLEVESGGCRVRFQLDWKLDWKVFSVLGPHWNLEVIYLATSSTSTLTNITLQLRIDRPTQSDVSPSTHILQISYSSSYTKYLKIEEHFVTRYEWRTCRSLAHTVYSTRLVYTCIYCCGLVYLDVGIVHSDSLSWTWLDCQAGLYLSDFHWGESECFDWRLATIAGMEVAKLVPWNSLLN